MGLRDSGANVSLRMVEQRALIGRKVLHIRGKRLVVPDQCGQRFSRGTGAVDDGPCTAIAVRVSLDREKDIQRLGKDGGAFRAVHLRRHGSLVHVKPRHGVSQSEDGVEKRGEQFGSKSRGCRIGQVALVFRDLVHVQSDHARHHGLPHAFHEFKV